MSDSRDGRNERQLQDRMRMMVENGYQVDPETLYRLANNNPAGFGDMSGVAPGTALTPEQVQQMFSTFQAGKYTDGSESMTLQQYLADPRSAIRSENGQYVYRPEAMQGDFMAKDQESFLESFGPFALAAGLMGGLPMATAMGAFGAGGAAGAGSGGLGGASLGAEELFTGLNSLVPGGSGVAEAIAAGAGGAGANMGGSLAADEFLNTMSNFVPGGSGAAEAAAAVGAGAGAASGAGTAASALSKFLGIDQGTLDMIGKGLGLGLGVYGANQQADASKDLFDQYMGMGAPYRAELQNLNANPSSFYSSPIFQGALQQGSDALSRSLSAKVGNPILNPTALQSLQDYTTKGSLDAYNNRWNQLASAGQLGVSQAAPLGQQSNQAQGTVYNAFGAGLQSLLGNQRDYTGELIDLARQRESNRSSSGNTYNLPGWGP